jgi:uncharacterized protein YndB with AHSA1/START domain
LERIVLAILVVALATATHAEVIETSANGFLIKHQVMVAATPDKAYRAFVGDIGRWWNPDHTYSGDAANLSLGARPGGCFCEKLAKGGGAMHMSVVYVVPGQTVRLAGGLGPLQGSGVAGSMTWKFTPDAEGTKIELAYSVGGYMQGGFEKMAPAVNFVIGEQLTRLKTYVETGKPTVAK